MKVAFLENILQQVKTCSSLLVIEPLLKLHSKAAELLATLPICSGKQGLKPIIFHGKSSITLQEVAPQAPIYDDREDFIVSQYEFEIIGSKNIVFPFYIPCF